MKTKLITGLLATATVAACLMPATVHATGTTTGGDTVITTEPGVPTECIEYYLGIDGPSRASHSKAPSGAVVVALPNCEDVEGICVELVFPDVGPSRSPHGVVTTSPTPCVPAGPECDIVWQVFPTGPARSVHQPSGVAPTIVNPYVIVAIPSACQGVLSGAGIPATGSDSTNTIWLAVTLVGLGAVMLFTRRVATVRAR